MSARDETRLAWAGVVQFLRVFALICLSWQVAHAERYVLQIGGLPPVYLRDAPGYLARLQPVNGFTPAGMTTPSPAFQLPTPPGPVNAAAKVSDPTSAQPATPNAQPPDGVPCDMDTALAAPAGPPTAQFQAKLQSTYNITNAADVNATWTFFQAEPKVLSFNSQVANSVVRYIMAMNGPLPGQPADPKQLKPQATSGTVNSSIGILVHATPWGQDTTALTNGTAVTLIPPAEGPWYRLSTGGWVCGLWLNLQ